MTTNKPQHIVIIGSGMAAYMLAQSIRQESETVEMTIITERDGRFYPKPMLSTALFHNKKPENILTASAEVMAEKYRLQILTHQAIQRIDTNQRRVIGAGLDIAYDKLVLAVGSEANQLPNIRPVEGYCSVNSMEDYEHLLTQLSKDKKVLIIGSGLVGVEFAHDLLKAGYTVSMVSQDEAALWPLVPREVGRLCRDHLISMGLHWFVDKGVTDVQRMSDRVQVDFTDQARCCYDVVLSAIGIGPRTELATAMGLTVNKGIVTDCYGQTSETHIYALGDCAETHGLVLTYVAPMKQQAQAMAKTLLGEPSSIHYPAMPVVVKMPTFPLTMVPVRQVHTQGQWQIVVNSHEEGVVAANYHPNGRLQGFVLAGPATKLRNQWLAQMPQSIVDAA